MLSDFRFAARGMGRLTVTKLPEQRKACQVQVLVWSLEVPGKSELSRVVARLEKRGWRLDGPASVDSGGYLASGEWNTVAGVGPVPEEVEAQASPNRGALLLSGMGRCRPV